MISLLFYVLPMVTPILAHLAHDDGLLCMRLLDGSAKRGHGIYFGLWNVLVRCMPWNNPILREFY